MAPFSVDAWILLGAVAAICLLAFFYALATLYRDQTRIHDLRARVHDLRREYAERLARERAEEIIEVIPEADESNQTSPEPARAAA